MNANRRMRNDKRKRKVVQLDMNGNYIKTWDSLHQIYNELNMANRGLVGCVKHRKGFNSAYGFKWLYLDEYEVKS